MKTSGKIGSSGVLVSDNVEQRFETYIYKYIRGTKTQSQILHLGPSYIHFV